MDVLDLLILLAFLAFASLINSALGLPLCSWGSPGGVL